MSEYGWNWKNDLVKDWITQLEKISGLRFKDETHSKLYEELYGLLAKYTNEA